MFKKYFVAASAVFLLASGVANAAVSNFQFTGTVTYGGDLAATGNQITGAFSYDTDALSSYTIGGHSSYSLPAPFGLSASVNGHSLVANNLHVDVWDNFGGNVEDMVDIYGGYPASVDGNLYPNGSFGFRLASKPGATNVLTGTALPSFFDVAAFNAGPTLNYGWLQRDGAPGGTLLQFSVDSIVLAAPVPEANTYAMFLAGLSLLGFTAYRRKNSGK